MNPSSHQKVYMYFSIGNTGNMINKQDRRRIKIWFCFHNMKDYGTRWEQLSQQKTRPIAYIQWHLHSAVLLAVSCIDRMNGIDGNEMNLASQSANSGRLQNPLSFFSKVIDLKTFGPPSGSKVSSRPLSSEIMKNVTKMLEYSHLWQNHCVSLCFVIHSSNMLLSR